VVSTNRGSGWRRILYIVSVIVGDQLFAHDSIEIYAGGELKASISSGVGEFVQRSFAVSVSDGRLELLLRDAGGVDPNWVINALIIEEYTMRKFDFGSETSPVAQGYTRITPSTAYSQPIGYGWVSTSNLQSRDRGLPDDLRRDFVFSSSNGTFRVDVQNGKYVVMLLVGDQYYRHDNIKFFAEGAFMVEVTVDAGKFVQKSFVVSVADGSLELNIYDSGGTDPNWVINALIVEPYVERKFDFGTVDSPVEPGYVQVTSGSVFSNTIGYGWDYSNSLVSRNRDGPDSLRRDFVFSSIKHSFKVNLAKGQYLVLVIMGDENYMHDNMYVYMEGILKANVSTNIAEFKIEALEVTVTDGCLDIIFEDGGGSDPNWVVNGIQIEEYDSKAIRFDFGTPYSPIELGYKRADPSTAYSKSKGYGWIENNALYSRDRGLPSDLCRDFVFSSFDKTFQVDLPNGEYRVHIIVGDQWYMHDRIDVYAENNLAVNDLTVRAGLFVEEYFTVVVKDGQLNLKFHDDGGTDPNWVINALIIDV